MTVVLPQLSQLTWQNLMEAACLFFVLQPICDTQSMEAIVAAFQEVAFIILDARRTLCLASYLYHDMPSFRTLQLQNFFVPKSYFKKLRSYWKAVDFLLKAGVCTSFPVEDFVALAEEVEHEATRGTCHAAELLD
ncbi:hypothetical protein Nmel_014845 [Mimus melanotis]